MIAWLRVGAGLALLFLGRRLFWLTLAALGFVAGMTYAGEYLPGQAEVPAVVIGLIAGGIGAVLAIFLQKVAVGVAGFLAGGYLALGLVRLFGADPGAVWFIVGGVVGLILIYPLFDWALMFLSSLAGALILVQTVDLAPGLAMVLFVLAFGLGLVVQIATLRSRPKPAPAPPAAES
jgi:hypothetical protein